MASVLAQGEKEGDKKLIQRSQARWKRDGCGENRRASLLRASLVTNTSNLIPFSSFRVLYKLTWDFSVSGLSGGDHGVLLGACWIGLLLIRIS